MRRARLLVLPVALGVLIFVTVRLAVAPLGDAIAGTLTALVAPPPRDRSAVAPEVAVSEAKTEPDTVGLVAAPPRTIARIASRAPVPRRETLQEPKDAGARVASPTDPPKATIVVPASAVARAMERRDVGATNAVAADGSPLGARLAGVSKYRTGLRDGDVVVSVAGTRTPTVEALVGAGLSAAGGGATRLSGLIVRGESTYAVVIELPR